MSVQWMVAKPSSSVRLTRKVMATVAREPPPKILPPSWRDRSPHAFRFSRWNVALPQPADRG